MNPLISVIVPVYKVEEYLDRCVESIVEQTYQNLEIILVDDGSPDNCPKLCDEWAEKDSRIKVIHKENGGLSDARNCGVKISNGEYITFIDSDDFVLPEYVEYLYSILNKNNADISCCGLKYVYTTDRLTSFSDNKKDDRIQAISGIEACYKMYESEYNVYLVVANCKLYKKSLVENHPYPLGRLHEDEATTYKMLYEAKTVALSDKKLYGYYQNSNSIMHFINQKHTIDYCWSFSNRADFFNKNGYQELATATWDKLAEILIMIYKINKERFTKKEVAFFCKHLLNRNLSKDTAKKFFLYILSPKLYEKSFFNIKDNITASIQHIKHYLLILAIALKSIFVQKKKKVFVLTALQKGYNINDNISFFNIQTNTYLVCKNILSKLIKKDDLIVIDGGKSSGSYNYYIENIIRDIVSSFPVNKIIITPKKIAFDNNDTADKELWLSKTAFSKNKNVIYYCEDEASLDFLNKNFKDINQIILSKETDLCEIINL